MPKDKKTCEARIDEHLARTVESLETLIEWEQGDHDDEGHPDLGKLIEYGLSFDYVGELPDDRPGYWRYQLSWGGPSDELRFYCNNEGKLLEVEYWFMDHFDGAHRELYHHRDGPAPDWIAFLWMWFESSIHYS